MSDNLVNSLNVVPEFMTHVVITVFTDILEVLSRLELQIGLLDRIRTLCLPPARMHWLLSALWPSHTSLFHMRTFCELTALFRCAKSEFGSTVPKNMVLYWFMPAFVNRSVGSESGTTEEEGTATSCESR